MLSPNLELFYIFLRQSVSLRKHGPALHSCLIEMFSPWHLLLASKKKRKKKETRGCVCVFFPCVYSSISFSGGVVSSCLAAKCFPPPLPLPHLLGRAGFPAARYPTVIHPSATLPPMSDRARTPTEDGGWRGGLWGGGGKAVNTESDSEYR